MLINKTIKLVCLALAVSVLLSCASKVRTSITTFQNEDKASATGTIYITSPNRVKAQQGLQLEFYKKKLAARLETIGYRVTDSQQADFVAFLDYGVIRRESEASNSHVQLGLGFGRYSRFGRLIFTEPLTKQFEYVRRVQLAIEKNVGQGSTPSEAAGDKLVELDAVSLGRCAQLIEVFDPMLEAIFKNFYLADGSTEKVIVPGGGTCK